MHKGGHVRYSHPNKLLEKPQEILLFNLLEQASRILTDSVEEMLVEPPVGLYVKGQVKPILNDRDVYYPRFRLEDPDARIVDFSKVFDLNDDIVDVQGNVIVTNYNLCHRRHLFTLKPTLPVSAIQICYNVIIDYLFRYCKHAKGIKLSRIDNLIKPEYHDTFDESLIEEYLSNALDELHDFIFDSSWNIYMHKLNGTTLIIEKMIDFRIYSWTEMQYQKQQEQEGDFY